MYQGVLAFIGGLAVGSFLNVVIYRLPREESIVFPGSHCTYCGRLLRALDLVPVLSYLGLRGRCRYCRARISLRYPLVEVLTAVLYLLVIIEYGWSWLSVAGALLSALLIACAFIDLDHGIIPDAITYPGIITGLFLSYFTVGVSSALLGLMLFGGILLLTALLSRGGMGGGDIKLAAMIGAFTGLQGSIAAFVMSSLAGGLWALYLLITKKADRKTAIKFGPFLALGGWLAYLYGERILQAYFLFLR